ncbi:hypothetical protein HY024_04030, partial [Candidatus Curtissbacteria bacterium]|nr:hypothetical protein [Candidatus Curtissbacteria bacterium]
MKFQKAIIIATSGLLALTLAGCKAKTVTTTPSTSGLSSPAASSSDMMSGEVMVNYDGTAFSPATVKAKVGEKVTFKNTGSGNLSVNSDPH